MHNPTPTLAWISHGRLFVRRGDQPVQEIESDFARDALERDQRHHDQNAWKGRSGVWGSLGMEPPGLAPWEAAEPQRVVRFVCVCRGASPGELYYVLQIGPVGGLFCYDLERHEETRLMHRQGFVATALSRSPHGGQLIFSVRRDDATVGLTVARHDGLFGRNLSMSDSIDEAPRWRADQEHRVVFQSAAVIRNEGGVPIGQSPYRIEQLDLDSEEAQCIAEEEDHDLLQPQVTNDGQLHYIRRPYRPAAASQVSFWQLTQDVVLFPFRLARTFVYLFNFLSMAVTGKPLMSAGGPHHPSAANSPWLTLYGQAIDTRQALQKNARNADTKPLVPKEWTLVRRLNDGTSVVISEHVLDFDVNEAGDCVWTDGRRIFYRNDSSDSVELAQADLIEKVCLLE